MAAGTEEVRGSTQLGPKTHLVTFATVEPPGLPLLEHAVRFSTIAKEEGGIDLSHIYTPQKMRELGQEWCVATYSENARLRANINPTYHLIGLGAWAFVSILDVLDNHAAPNELVVYHNINISKYPYYIDRAKHLRRLAESCLKFHEAENFHGMMTGERVGCTCKYETLLHASREWAKYYPAAFAAPGSIDELARVAMQQFNFVAIRNTDSSRKFFRMLVAECRKYGKDILAPATQYPDWAPQPHGVWHFRHTAEQAVYNAYAAQNSALMHGIRNQVWLKAFASNPPNSITSIATDISRILTLYGGTLFIGQRLAPSQEHAAIPTQYVPERTELTPISNSHSARWFLTNDSATAPSGEMVVFKRSGDGSPMGKESAIWRSCTGPAANLRPNMGASHRCYLTLANDGIVIIAVDDTGATISRSHIAHFGMLESQPLFLEMQGDGNLVVYSDKMYPMWHTNTFGK